MSSTLIKPYEKWYSEDVHIPIICFLGSLGLGKDPGQDLGLGLNLDLDLHRDLSFGLGLGLDLGLGLGLGLDLDFSLGIIQSWWRFAVLQNIEKPLARQRFGAFEKVLQNTL